MFLSRYTFNVLYKQGFKNFRPTAVSVFNKYNNNDKQVICMYPTQHRCFKNFGHKRDKMKPMTQRFGFFMLGFLLISWVNFRR